jgi:hypothetical protein
MYGTMNIKYDWKYILINYLIESRARLYFYIYIYIFMLHLKQRGYLTW